MTGPGSQLAANPDPLARAHRTHRLVRALLAGLVFLTAAAAAIAALPHTMLARTVDAHLTQLADPRSWVP